MLLKPDSLSGRLFQAWFDPQGRPLTALERLFLGLLEALYGVVWSLREWWAKRIHRPRRAHGIRVIGVGNLLVGGAGKTPCVLGLAQAFQKAHLKCAVITRGYRSLAEQEGPTVVNASSLAQTTAQAIGDEAWLLAWRTGLPVAVGKDRWASLVALRAAHPDLQVVLLDDGLQQRSLACDEKILVVDERGFGNQRLLPRGPLREPIGDLGRFTAWVDHGCARGQAQALLKLSEHKMPALEGQLTQSESAWVPLAQWKTPSQWPTFSDGLAQFRHKKILAVAGIAVPQRFFNLLQTAGLACDLLALHDHDPDTVPKVQQAWESGHYEAILMTEKDAVKFFGQPLALCDHAWALRREACLTEPFLKRLIDGSKTS